MHELLPGEQRQLLVWTGDNTRHDNDPTHPIEEDDVYKSLEYVTQRLTEAVGNTTFIVPSLGPTDVFPHGQLGPGPNAELKRIREIWAHLLPDDPHVRTNFLIGGYHFRRVRIFLYFRWTVCLSIVLCVYLLSG